MRKVLINVALSMHLIALFSVPFLVSGTASAQSADTIEQQAAQCAENGGEWDGVAGKCIGDNSCQPGQSILGIPTWYKYLDGEEISGKCRPIIDTAPGDDVSVGRALPIGLAVLEAMMTLGGLIAVVMIFVGSFKFVITQGEPNKINEAKNTVINSVVGLVIVIIATRIVSFIAGRIG